MPWENVFKNPTQFYVHSKYEYCVVLCAFHEVVQCFIFVVIYIPRVSLILFNKYIPVFGSLVFQYVHMFRTIYS